MISVEPQKTSSSGFPLARFKELYNKSYAMTFLADGDRAKIERAMKEDDVNLLGTIYQTLLQEKESEKKIAQDFDSAKNRIVGEYMVSATGIRKKYVQAPMAEKIASAVQEEKAAAEEILKKI